MNRCKHAFSSVLAPVHADASTVTVADINSVLANSDCPEIIKSTFVDIVQSGATPDNLKGTYYVAYNDSSNEIIGLSCSSAAKIESMVIRIFVVIMSIVGLVFAYSIARSAILLITAFDDEEKFKAGIKGLQTGIIATVAIFFSYITLVFVLVGVLGLGNNRKSEWDIFCQNKIVFSVTFESGVSPCK